MVKQRNSDGAVGWISWISFIFVIAALFVLLGRELHEAFQSEVGVIVVTLTATLSTLLAARCRRFGMLAGMALPVIFGMALALHWSQSAVFGWRLAGLGTGLFLAIIGVRLAMHLIAIDLKSRESSLWLFIFVVLLPLLLVLGFRMGWERISEIPHGLELLTQKILLVWGLLLMLWRPTLFLRTLIFILGNTLYRPRIMHEERFPDYGPVMVVANHVSFLDALFIMGLKPRKITIMVHHNFYRLPFFHFMFRWIGALEVPNANQPKKMQQFFDNVKQVLSRGGVVCVFPEGAISSNGLTQEFKGGLASMLPNSNVTIIPINIGMLWGSLFRMYKGHMRFITPRKLPIPCTVFVGEKVPADWSGFRIWQKIGELGAEAEMEPMPGEKTIHYRLLKRSKQHPFQVTYHDHDEKQKTTNLKLLISAVALSKKFRQVAEMRGDDGDNMGLLLPNRMAAAAALLGIWYADRHAAILNFTAGPEAMRAMIDRAKLKTVITSRLFLAKLKIDETPEMLCLEDIAKLITKSDRILTALQVIFVPYSVLIRQIAPASWDGVKECAAILFSSGSTGTPKGVMLSHRNLNSNIMSFWREMAWRPDDFILGNLPLFHAFGLMADFCFPAVTGTQCVFVPNPLDGATIGATVRKFKVTITVATPTFMQSYLRSIKPGDFDSLRLAITGAEKLQRKLFDQFKEATGLNIIEGYGCTEMSPIVSINLSSSLFRLGRESGPFGSVGVPMPGIAIKVIDPDTGKELGENEPGLMYLKGGSVMMGYLDNPEATAAAITPDGYYNTNDIVTVDRNGYIRIVGRLSRFSKIGGEMVPHEMVERRLEEITKLDNHIVVTSRPDPRKGEQLVVLYQADEPLVLEPVLAAMRESGLPNLWIPRADCFYKVDAIPMLGNGKKDLKKMQELAKSLGQPAPAPLPVSEK